MQYTQAVFQITSELDFVKDMLTQFLSDINFDSFIDNDDNSFTAFIPTASFNKDALNTLLTDFPFEGINLLSIDQCEDKDWNEEWERNSFQPIRIGTNCVIKAPFHKLNESFKHEIIINPKMAFGTGSHQTTYLILSTLLTLPLQDKLVLDMGCGTGVLAILSRKLGAKNVTAIDIDDWCTNNTAENCELNNINDIEILLGDAKLLDNKHFDIIIANINRNILLMDMPQYAKALNPHGLLIISGFYTEDIPILTNQANQLNLTTIATNHKDNWAMLVLKS